MNKRIPLAVFLGLSALMVSIGWAQDAVPKPATPTAGAEARDPQKASPDQIRSWFKQLDGTHRLPITGLTLAQSGDKLLLISDNGRFAVVGNFRLLDVWNAQEIKSLQDADRLDRLDIKRIGIKDGDLARLKLGTGAETVTVFVDPLCPHCHHLIQQMDALKKDYTFDLVISPVLGEKSADISRKLASPVEFQEEGKAARSQRDDARDTPLIRAPGLAYYWQKLVDEVTYRSIMEVTAAEGDGSGAGRPDCQAEPTATRDRRNLPGREGSWAVAGESEPAFFPS